MPKIKKRDDIIINILGILIFLFGITALVNSLYMGYAEGVLWFCYLGLILIGIGLLRKDSNLILSQLNILTIPLIIWSVDFFYYLFTGNPLLGITNYFFITSGNILGKIVSLQHIFTIPLTLYVLYLIKIKKNKAWLFSSIQIMLIYIITRLFTSQEKNINCVYKSCMSFTLQPYIIMWFAGMFAMIFLTNFILIRLKIFRE